MNEKKRQAIVWDAIERMAFRPASSRDRDGWLSVYVRTLHRLWQLQPTDVPTRHSTGFDALFLDLACDYVVETPDQYSVTIINVAAHAPACWHLHVDPGYCSRASYYHAAEDYPAQDINTHLKRDVATVLDGMIFHPRNHAHGDALGIIPQLAPDAPTLPLSEIRLGGGIENGFVFLTHLRYQFCLLAEDARQTEQNRLVRLFADAMRERRQAVPAADLFALRT